MRFATLCGAVLLLATLEGCGSPGTAPTEPVSGTVLYKGQPLEGVTVIFTPKEGRPASGTTDAAGRFALSTFAEDDGAVAGSHQVSLAPKASGEPMLMPGMPGADKQAAPLPFPAKYRDPGQSGLTADVKPSETNDFKFELTD